MLSSLISNFFTNVYTNAYKFSLNINFVASRRVQHIFSLESPIIKKTFPPQHPYPKFAHHRDSFFFTVLIVSFDVNLFILINMIYFHFLIFQFNYHLLTSSPTFFFSLHPINRGNVTILY